MSYLLDTNVVSETRKRIPDGPVLSWLEATDDRDLFVSVLTFGEITKGIAMRRRADPTGAASLQHWLRGIAEMFSDRILPVDTAVATAWGGLAVGENLPVIDALLAATAIHHGHTLVTPNVKDIEATGVAYLNPWTPA